MSLSTVNRRWAVTIERNERVWLAVQFLTKRNAHLVWNVFAQDDAGANERVAPNDATWHQRSIDANARACPDNLPEFFTTGIDTLPLDRHFDRAIVEAE